MGDIDNIFVGADAVVRRHGVIRERITIDFQTPAGMRGTDDCALPFRPAQSVQAQRGPMFVGIAARINLLLQPQKTEMAGLVRTEARDFDVITQQVRVLRDLVHLSAKKLLLKIETWSPGQIAAHFQILALAMPVHVARQHAFGRRRVMRAPGRMDMMVTRPPAKLRRLWTGMFLARR